MATVGAPIVAVGAQRAPLEELMVAMDVVDTMRHRQILIDRELDADARRARLRARLREIYAAQGIEVSDDALDAGIAALEEERFSYIPPADGLAVTLAEIYVSRSRWIKPVRLFAAFFLVVFAAWYLMVGLPAQRLRAELPGDIETVYSRILDVAAEDAALARGRELNAAAQAALADDDYDRAGGTRDEMRALLQRLTETYELRIVARPDELSGVWRVPDINEEARNYYLIVEAVAPSGAILSLPITSEEDGQTRAVTKWGVRVSEATFEAIAADKRDDGIIQDNVIGSKPLGRITPEYRIATAGGAITDW